MTALRASVVVVSRNRPERLSLCLGALAQLRHDAFEIIVVADPDALAVVDTSVVKIAVPFDVPNVAAARNLGVGYAAGEIIVFIDDDAVAEPYWLTHLMAPFADARVAAAGGYVVGRNGISLQWAGLSVDARGADWDLPSESDETVVLAREAGGRAIRTQGTNMAVRRDVLVALGGFDESFTFFHDDTDLNMRIAVAGYLTAVVPRARVHHAVCQNILRRADRGPTDLFQIGFSSAIFHKKHLPEREWAAAREDLAERQHRRLAAYLVDGRIEPRDVARMSRRLLSGYDAGLLSSAARQQPIPPQPNDFRASAVPPPQAPGCWLAGPQRDRAGLREEAKALAGDGQRPVLFLFSRTALFHQMRFRQGRYWEQSGGVYGKSDRSDPLMGFYTFQTRLKREIGRVSVFNGRLIAAEDSYPETQKPGI